MRFTGTKDYVATEDLKVAVNAAIVLERPLLVKGEPGTGKTVLAEEIAKAMEAPLLTWHIKSTTKAQQGLYEYDAVSRLRDSQLGDEKVKDISNYIVRGVLWQAFEQGKPCGFGEPWADEEITISGHEAGRFSVARKACDQRGDMRVERVTQIIVADPIFEKVAQDVERIAVIGRALHEAREVVHKIRAGLAQMQVGDEAGAGHCGHSGFHHELLYWPFYSCSLPIR